MFTVLGCGGTNVVLVAASAGGATVAARSATATTTAPTGAASAARQVRRKRRWRTGCSTKWYEATDTTAVAARRTSNSRQPSSPVWALSSMRKIGQ